MMRQYDIEEQIAIDNAALEQLFLYIDQLDAVEELAISDGVDTSAVTGASVEALGSDKFLNNLQNGRRKWYESFIATSERLYTNSAKWLHLLEMDKSKLITGMANAKKNNPEIGDIVADNMYGKYPSIISLINGVDIKQLKMAKDRYINLPKRIKSNVSFMNKMMKFSDKEFGFNDLIDDGLEPIDIVKFLEASFLEEYEASASLQSIKLFGIQRRFKTDKRAIMKDIINAEGSRTTLINWGGNNLQYFTTTAKGEMRIFTKTIKSPKLDYSDFFKRYSADTTKHISDTSGITHLVTALHDSVKIYKQVNLSLSKLYMPSDRTFDELKYIRRFHLSLVRMLHARNVDFINTYKLSYDIAKIATKYSTT